MSTLPSMMTLREQRAASRARARRKCQSCKGKGARTCPYTGRVECDECRYNRQDAEHRAKLEAASALLVAEFYAACAAVMEEQ